MPEHLLASSAISKHRSGKLSIHPTCRAAGAPKVQEAASSLGEARDSHLRTLSSTG